MQDRDEHFFEDDDRHRILEAIEEQAKNLSMARGANQHRLSDWLNAAEEVMPEVKKPTVKPMSMSGTDSRSSSSSIMGVLVMGTLLLTLAGGGGFAYMQLQTQVQNIVKENQALREQVSALEASVTALKSTEPSSKVASAGSDDVTNAAVAPQNHENGVSQPLESLLDARFKQLIEHIDKRMDAKPAPMQPIMPISTAQPPMVTTATPPTVAAPVAPAMVEMQPAASAAVPVVAGAVSETVNPDQWLFDLSANALVLQLGSNVRADGLEAMIKKIHHAPELAHILAVKANGHTRYVLAYGGFTSREEAKQASERLKQELGVSPWIRKASDVQLLVEKH